MDQHARSVRLAPLQSVRSMATSAMMVEREWFIYLFAISCSLCTINCLLCELFEVTRGFQTFLHHYSERMSPL